MEALGLTVPVDQSICRDMPPLLVRGPSNRGGKAKRQRKGKRVTFELPDDCGPPTVLRLGACRTLGIYTPRAALHEVTSFWLNTSGWVSPLKLRPFSVGGESAWASKPTSGCDDGAAPLGPAWWSDSEEASPPPGAMDLVVDDGGERRVRTQMTLCKAEAGVDGIESAATVWSTEVESPGSDWLHNYV
jgi:hypothetical protein